MAGTLPILLMTRPQAASEGFAEALRDRADPFDLVISPLMDIAFAASLPPTGALRGLVFTSANGVAAWCALGGPTDLPVWTVGPATAAAAEAAGLNACAAKGDADSLVALLARQSPEGPLLHIRGTHARGDVAARLTQAGVATREAVLYDQPERPLTETALAALAGNRPVVAPVFSPRTGVLLARAPMNAPLLVAAMSEAVAKAVASLHIRTMMIAPRPESRAMLDCTAELVARASLLVTPGGEE